MNNKKSLIVGCAERLFSAHGIANVSMERIARDAGISKQTIYSYYGSKDALFEEVVKQICARHKFDPSELDVNLPVAEYLKGFLSLVNERGTNKDLLGLFRACISASLDHPRAGRILWQEGPGDVLQSLERYLNDRVREGSLNIHNVEYATQQLLAASTGLNYIKFMLGIVDEGDFGGRSAYIDDVVTSFLKVYSAKLG